MAAETGFTINGEVYELPQLASFTMDEAQILWDLCQRGIEDFVPDLEDGGFSPDRLADVALSMKNPAFRRTLMYVGYWRRHPEAGKREIDAAIGSVSNTQALQDWVHALDEEDDASPPVLTPEPNRSSSRSSDDSSENSGTASGDDSDAPAGQLVPITAGSSPPSESTLAVSAG